MTRWESETTTDFFSRERIEALSAAALAAPSADNRLVFRLRVAEAALELHATGALLHADRSRRVLGLMAVGAASENLVLRGRRLGLALQPDWHPGPPGESLLVRFGASHCPLVRDSLEAVIESRHTNRRTRFQGPHLDEAHRSQLSAESDAVPGSAVVWLDAVGRRSAALRLILRAEAERFRNESLHRELFESVRFDAGWRASVAQGLPPGSLELPLPERGLFTSLRSWRIARLAGALGVPWMIGLRAADLPCRLAPHLLAIAVEGSGDAAAVSAGRLLQRVWLRATTFGLSCQPFAASPLYALEDSTAVPPSLRSMLAEGWRRLCPSGTTPFVVLRMGRAKAPSVRSGRPPLRDVLLDEPPEAPKAGATP